MDQRVIVQLVEQVLCHGRPFQLSDSDSMLEYGVADSLGMIELVKALERQFGIRVADEEFSPENLDSIDALEAYLRRKGVSL